MPKRMEDQVKGLKRDGYPEDQAYAIATANERRKKQKEELGSKPKKGKK